jgi:predicted regulator of Ras-like GTPase activity (Roadblock/LC7/MglB family)
MANVEVVSVMEGGGVAVGEVLQQLREEYGCDLAALVGVDGLLIEAATAEGLDAESVAANAVSGLLMMEALGRELHETAARQALIEFADHVVLVAPLGADVALVLVASGESNLGRLRLAVRRIRSRLEAEVAAL